MAIAILPEADFENKVLKNNLPVVVDFFATWCGPCKVAEPVLEELANNNEGKVEFLKIDVDSSQGLVQKYSVMSIPTTVLFKNGKEIGRQIGFSGKTQFEELLKKIS